MTDDTRDRLLDAIQDIARTENELLESRLERTIGELEQRVNQRLVPLERKMELPKRITALLLAAAGLVGGSAATILVDRLLGGGGG